MHNKLGVMQGRLLKKYQGRYQAHPLGYWDSEFSNARDLGLDCIEFILDFNDSELNPLLSDNGTSEILQVVEKTGVNVITICADYFMEAPLHSEDSEVALLSQKILQKLLDTGYKLGITDIVLPCVDQSSLVGQKVINRFVENLYPLLDIAEKKNINLSLETDLSPHAFGELLNRFDSNRLSVNYDIGNSASLGFDPIEELNVYGHKITDIHIKDRVLNGGPIELGKGAADFKTIFKKLKEIDYKGPFIMQAYRDEEGIEIFKKQLKWVTPYLESLYE
jgi:L-ribulose-5-phosphate 3-epimerase